MLMGTRECQHPCWEEQGAAASVEELGRQHRKVTMCVTETPGSPLVTPAWQQLPSGWAELRPGTLGTWRPEEKHVPAVLIPRDCWGHGAGGVSAAWPMPSRGPCRKGVGL